jgi:hypothetical protein
MLTIITKIIRIYNYELSIVIKLVQNEIFSLCLRHLLIQTSLIHASLICVRYGTDAKILIRHN